MYKIQFKKCYNERIQIKCLFRLSQNAFSNMDHRRIHVSYEPRLLLGHPFIIFIYFYQYKFHNLKNTQNILHVSLNQTRL